MVARLADYQLRASIFIKLSSCQATASSYIRSKHIVRAPPRKFEDHFNPGQKKKKSRIPNFEPSLLFLWLLFCIEGKFTSQVSRIIRRGPTLKAPPKIQGANLAGSPSDFSTPPPTSCWSINSNISLRLRGGKTPCVLVLCGVHVAISGCVYAAPA